MIDVKLIVEDRERVKKALLKRMKEEDLDLDTIVELFNKRKLLLADYEKIRAEQRSYNDKMAAVKKGSDDFKELVAMLKEKAEDVKAAAEKLEEAETELKAKVDVLPNIPDEDVPAGEKESNEVVREEGQQPKFDFEIKDHLDIGLNLGLLDMERATKIAGASFAMYTDMGARLEWALINYFIGEHIKDGYRFILPPHLLTEQSGYGAGQLPKFKEDVYWVQDGNFLLPTAETALANLYRDETLAEKDLPLKLFAYTPCYRREAGSYRAKERGLMRMHQFNKVEMFAYATPAQSAAVLEELVGKAEKLVKELGLHYRVVKLAAGDCSAGAAKTYDVEVWLPYLQQYYEVSSVSNVTDYQARRGNVRFKPEKDSKPEYVHMLNASGLATSRLMVALLETYQNSDGSLTVPEVLRPFLGVDKIEK
jgi:seryl-tRNA synthetase